MTIAGTETKPKPGPLATGGPGGIVVPLNMMPAEVELVKMAVTNNMATAIPTRKTLRGSRREA